MKRIILTSLFFCLAITTVLAQVTPVDTTKTSTSTVSGVTVIGIATPDSNGLSNNTYSDFNISSSGIILNNSSSSSSSQLTGGSVSGNSNITGSPASLILNQVTSTNASSLLGTAEVVGSEAGLIIANPNGIRCGGCAFINTDRVDLVTGTYNIATGTYSISDNDFTVDNGGLLARNVGVLNIQTNNFTLQGGSGIDISADTFNLSVAGDFTSGYETAINVNTFNLSVAGDFHTSAASRITANTFNFSLAGDFAPGQHAEISADTFNLSVAGDFDNIAYYIAGSNIFITNSEGRLFVDAFNLNVGGDFTFSNSANNFIWRANDTLTVSGSASIDAASFNNSGTITVTNNSFNASVDTFINEAGATISAFGECNIVSNSYTDDGTINCQDFVDDAMVIDIVAPNSNGLSDNQVDDFSVNSNSYGTILNNSAGGGTAQLGVTAVTGNGNITTGSEADLILFQVTGSTGSDFTS